MDTITPVCKICGKEIIEEVISNSYKYFKCEDCYTSQLFPQPSQKDLENYYSKYHLSVAEGGCYDSVEDRMQIDFPAKLSQIRSYLSSNDVKLLDVGCGKGFFIKKASEVGFDAYGIDISESGIKYAKEKLNVKVDLKSVEEASKDPFYIGRFDVVTLWATIEHIPNPYSLLSSIAKLLKKDGLLFLDTGLGDDKIEKLLTGHSQWYDAPQHLFVFSQKSLKVLLEKSGFKIIKIDRNFDRSKIRKFVRYLRHFYFSVISYLFIRPFLGKNGFISMKKESKWPIGKLIQIIAIKL